MGFYFVINYSIYPSEITSKKIGLPKGGISLEMVYAPGAQLEGIEIETQKVRRVS
jgi:hypothetical protein